MCCKAFTSALKLADVAGASYIVTLRDLSAFLRAMLPHAHEILGIKLVVCYNEMHDLLHRQAVLHDVNTVLLSDDCKDGNTPCMGTIYVINSVSSLPPIVDLIIDFLKRPLVPINCCLFDTNFHNTFLPLPLDLLGFHKHHLIFGFAEGHLLKGLHLPKAYHLTFLVYRSYWWND